MAVYATPLSLDPIVKAGSPALAAEFADWRQAIPPESTVYVADKYDTGSFVWFALSRPNYLSPDQSAGVVYSRPTALEIKRRSEVLLPLENPYWKIRSELQEHSNSSGDRSSEYRPLTATSLTSVCSDSKLGFVVAKEQVGFDPLTHVHVGAWNGWNLYDCSHVRSVDSRL
jgi:hypothetical protein